MELNLKKPLIFFDLETTGVNVTKDRIVELSYIKIYPNGKEEERTIRLNPEMPIPPQATAVHHITDEDVKDKPTFNSNKFDVPLLSEEFYRAGVQFDVSKRKMVDIQTIFHKMEQRTLVAAYKFYCGKNLEEAHSANADTRATYEVLKAQLDRYPTLENDVDFLAKYSSQNRNVDLAGRIVLNDQDVEVFNFGKYKGQPVETVLKKDPGYFGWILQGDFAQNTKSVLTNIKLRMK